MSAVEQTILTEFKHTARDVEQTLFTTFEENGVYHIQCSGLVPGPGHVYATLVVGTDKAMLIDNGWGEDNIAEYAAELAGKEVIPIITHVHPDHLGGMTQFSDMWIPEIELENAKSLFSHLPYNEETKTLGNTRLHCFRGGEVFDLGGRTITLVPTPGHTWGSVCMYDSGSRLMITGDTLSQRVFLFTANPTIPLRVYRESLQRLLEYDFDRFLAGHETHPMPRSWVEKMIGMTESFTPENGRKYNRPEFGETLMLYTVGKGFGDPEYCGFGYDQAELAAFLQ